MFRRFSAFAAAVSFGIQFRMRFRLIILLSLIGVISPRAEPPAYRYRIEVLAGDMPQPMELELAPDGRVFFNEIGGRLRIYKPDTQRVVEAGAIPVFTPQENGFLGFALDPNFSENQWIYLYYSATNHAGQHLSRFTMDGDRLIPESERVILKFGEQRQQCCHHAGTVEFAPDGCLLVSTGDNTHPGGDSKGYAPIDERPGREPWDAQKSSANTHDLRGKILRIRLKQEGGYEIPDGNLFPKDGSQGRPEIYVMGCRNPWRMSVDERTGIVYWGEVGPDAHNDGDRGSRGYDEINQARRAGNFGWPYFVGNNYRYADYDFATDKVGAIYDPARPVNSSPNNTGAKILPPAQPAFIYWPYAESPEFPMLGSGGRTACAGPVFHYRDSFAGTDGFPQEFDNCLLFWDWQRPFLKWARLDKDSNLLGIESFTDAVALVNDKNAKDLPADSTAFVIRRPVDAQFASDGTLYLLDYGNTWGANADSKLLRISYVRGNLPPVAKAAASPAVGREPLDVKLDAAGSKDHEGEEIRYEWTLRPGDKVIAKTASAKVTLNEPGNYIAELKVIDAGGLRSTANVPIVVGNSRPEVRFEEPRDGDFFTPGKAVAFKIRIDDREDGNSRDYDELMEGRTFVTANFKQREDDEETLAPGLAMMRGSDCFNCHAIEQKIVGPPLLEVAKRYRGVAGAFEATVQRVIKGSTGVWSEVPMLPHAQHSEQEVERMVRWIYDLKPGTGGQNMTRGLAGNVVVPKDPKLRFAFLQATYTDLGRAPAGSLAGKSLVRLRHRLIEGEHCDHYDRLRILGGNLGAIEDRATAVFKGIHLRDTKGITVRVSSGTQGGLLEVRAGSADGRLITRFEVKNTGSWGTYIELAKTIEPVDERTDVVCVFKNPGRSGLMNLDWIRFDP